MLKLRTILVLMTHSEGIQWPYLYPKPIRKTQNVAHFEAPDSQSKTLDRVDDINFGRYRSTHARELDQSCLRSCASIARQ